MRLTAPVLQSICILFLQSYAKSEDLSRYNYNIDNKNQSQDNQSVVNYAPIIFADLDEIRSTVGSSSETTTGLPRDSYPTTISETTASDREESTMGTTDEPEVTQDSLLLRSYWSGSFQDEQEKDQVIWEKVNPSRPQQIVSNDLKEAKEGWLNSEHISKNFLIAYLDGAWYRKGNRPK